jgi:hypothetical protein
VTAVKACGTALAEPWPAAPSSATRSGRLPSIALVEAEIAIPFRAVTASLSCHETPKRGARASPPPSWSVSQVVPVTHSNRSAARSGGDDG